jgi:hypothetical protein
VHPVESELGFGAALAHFAGTRIGAEDIPEGDCAFGQGAGPKGEVEQFRRGHLPELPTGGCECWVTLGAVSKSSAARHLVARAIRVTIVLATCHWPPS